MIGMVVMNKLRTFFLFFVTLFRRALCCFRRRRRLSYVEPLTDIGVISNKQSEEIENWNSWGDEFANKKPSTIQEHIEYYRQQKAQIVQQDEMQEEQADFFGDMTPRITAQKKLLINTNNKTYNRETNSLSLAPDVVIGGNELGEWDESSGWEGEKLEFEALEVLKEKKRKERERKALEQQQRRIERSTKTLAINVKVNA